MTDTSFIFEMKDDVVLKVGGFSYGYRRALSFGCGCPVINLDLTQLNPISGDTEVLINGKPNDNLQGPLIVFKQQGGYTVLAGRQYVVDAQNEDLQVVKARLISTPVLKRTRIAA